MANDGEVRIGTDVDNSGAEKGLKRLSQLLKNFANKLKSSDFANLGMSITGLGNAFKGVTTAVQGTIKVIKDVSEAYKTQIRAETQLDTAIKNSPYMDGSASKALKDYASEIQSVTTYGDEQLLPFMAELVNAGRSQEEVMDIMKAAVDLSASGMMDLGSAVSNLNMTLQGTTGTLGRQIGAIKNLTEEELKAGKAVEIIKKQFAGTAEEVAKNTGSAEQLKNAWGDLKEEIGAGFEKNMTPMRKFFTELIQGWTDARKKRREYEGIVEQNNSNKGNSSTYKTQLDEETKKLEEMGIRAKRAKELIELTNKEIKKSTEYIEYTTWSDSSNPLQDFKDLQEDILKNYDEQIIRVDTLNQKYKTALDEEKKAKQASELKAEEDARQSELNKSTENYNKIIAKRDATVANLKREAEALGQEVDQQAILNAEVTAYLEMAQDPNLPTMTGKQLELVQKLVKEYKSLTDDEKKYADFMQALGEVDIDVNKSDILRDQLRTMDELNEAFIHSSTFAQLDATKKAQLYSEYTQKRKKLEEEITKAVEEESEKQKTSIEDILSTLTNFLSQFTSTMNNIADLARSNAESNATLEVSSLKKQFSEGLIAEEEYKKRKEEIEKESARKQYELQMWEWSAQLLQIGLATAQAVMNGLKMTPAPLGLAMASTMGIAGASQLAVAMKNKPIPPSFAGGGIVGGGAYSSGDNIRANVKTGEMILNDKQQLNLWRMAQGGGSASGNQNKIEIKNYRGNDTTVTPQFTENGIKILIRKTVTDDLQNRRLNGALLSAENTLNGVKYES